MREQRLPQAVRRTRTSARRKPTFRPEVQGLRALAVLMVVTYHVWLGRVSGGVDVFLLISAFLLTLSFVRKVEAGTPLNLLRHWLHLFKRLLPAAVVVILGVLAGTWLILPQSRWPDVLDQAWASLLYRQNWLLADTAVDYYAQDHAGASPLQHFWSLSIQGQVFILWPLVFAGSALVWRLLRRRCNTSYRAVLAAAFAAILAASLAFSIEQTATNQAYAYFDTRTRLWEFALGSLLALALPYLKPGKALRVMLGWAGLAAMVSCGLVLTVDRSFPGFVALWPTLAAAAIIVAGQSGSRFGVDRLLSWKPLVALGDNSYALYLWHWPVLVLALAATGDREPNLIQGLAIIGASMVLAVLTTRFVEKPLREWHWPQVRAWRTAVVDCCLLRAAGRSGGRLADHPHRRGSCHGGAAPRTDARGGPLTAGERRQAHAGGPDHSGAGGHEERMGGTSTALYRCKRHSGSPAWRLPAEQSRPGDRTKRIVVLGDSHAQQYMAALGPSPRPRLGSGDPAEGTAASAPSRRDPERRMQRLQPGQRRLRHGTPAGCSVHCGLADP